MKIISKFKDFYDYKVTKYGVDEKLVYNRKTCCDYYKIRFQYLNLHKNVPEKVSVEDFDNILKEHIKFFNKTNHNKILIVGEKIVHLFFTEDGVYTHFDIKNPKDIGGETIYKYWAYHDGTKEITFNDGKKIEIHITFNELWDDFFNYDRKRFLSYLNISKEEVLFNEPIILVEYIGGIDRKIARYDNSVYKFTYNPNLSQMGVYIDEDFIWQSLVEFLSNKRSEREISPEVSNENKILSKGFDLKTSFRPNMIIGEKVIHLFFTENGAYTHLDIKNRKDIEKPYGCVESKTIIFNDDKKFDIFSAFPLLWPNLFSYDRNRLIRVNTDIPSDDIILNAPIFLIEYIGEYNDGTSRRQYFPPLYKFTYNPNLSQMGVYIDEDFIWQSLVEFLSNKRSEKEISPEVSNDNKILSKGFDLKTSFRPNMKKKHKGDI